MIDQTLKVYLILGLLALPFGAWFFLRVFFYGPGEIKPRGPRQQTWRHDYFAKTYEEYYANELYAEKIKAVAAEREARLKRREEYRARKRKERTERKQHPSGEIIKQGGRARQTRNV